MGGQGGNIRVTPMPGGGGVGAVGAVGGQPMIIRRGGPGEALAPQGPREKGGQ